MSQNSLILPTTGTVSGLQMTQDINYALDTLNTLNSGASAPSTVEAGMLWHDTTNNLIKLRNLANSAWVIIGSVDETNGLFIPAGTSTPVPQGRLTLASNTPVMNADAIAQTSIYYTPHNGNALPIYNGAECIANAFTQLTLALNTSNHPASWVFDVYASVQSGIVVLSAMYWGSNTSRSSSAGGKTGTGNAAIAQVGGLWVNAAAISSSDSFNGSTGYAIPQYQGTYLGSFYTTAAGQTGVVLKPAAATSGTNNIIGLFNAYNRIKINAMSRDSNPSYTYATNTWRTADGSVNNRISWVDGLQQIPVTGMQTNWAGTNTVGDTVGIGVVINSTTATPGVTGDGGSPTGTSVDNYQTLTAREAFYPQLGFNYIQAMEIAYSGATSTFNAHGTNQSLILETEY